MIILRQILYTALFLFVAKSAVSQDEYTVEVADDIYSYGNPGGQSCRCPKVRHIRGPCICWRSFIT